ncbi:hypothetical protein OHA21_50505 [Actinoplanes sp. NBC_00393]|uniref:hypothetical protein n=1 Tax=Actinoplanes sp. NBC_00393 TaxID=2975953 RepID=UPI002E247930
MDAPKDPEDLDAKIARLAATMREREQLIPRRAGITAAITQVSSELERLRRQLAEEEQDVGRLEGFTVDRVLTTLRGAHGRSLDRERAEVRQARDLVAGAQARLDDLHAQLRQVTARMDATGTAPATYAAALTEREQHLRKTSNGTGDRLTKLAGERERLTAELNHLQRAAATAGQAAEALREANGLLESADAWSAADTFLGGGSVSSSAKHHRLEEAAGHVAGAERLLKTLRDELDAGDLAAGDLAAPVAAPLGVDGTTRTIDIFFDNIFTDLDVRSQIDNGLAQIGRAAVRVRELRTSLSARIADLRTRLQRLDAERAKLLS